MAEDNLTVVSSGLFSDPTCQDFIELVSKEGITCFVFDGIDFAWSLEDLYRKAKKQVPDFLCYDVHFILFDMSGSNRDWSFEETLRALFGGDNPRLKMESAEEQAVSLCYMLKEGLSYFGKSLDELNMRPMADASFYTHGCLNAIYQKRRFDKNIEDVYANSSKRGIKKMLFFDLECANCFDDIGKVCEFGAVITDMEFNVLERVFLMINPDDRFMLRGRGGGSDLVLAYSEKDYFNSPKIAYYEKKIRDLLEDPETLVGGFAIDNDVSFLATDFDSYGLEQANYDCFDVQKWVSTEEGSISLEKAYQEWIPTEEKQPFREHRSVDDAEMTMLVAKFYAKKNEKPVLELLKEFPNSAYTSKGFIDYWASKRDLPMRKRPKKIVSFPYSSGHSNHSDS
ncbi:MAG: hypothetical protein K6F32_01430 [Bacilli bacterium]|nr:hypothetical protein [Bacilli bacterium]